MNMNPQIEKLVKLTNKLERKCVNLKNNEKSEENKKCGIVFYNGKYSAGYLDITNSIKLILNQQLEEVINTISVVRHFPKPETYEIDIKEFEKITEKNVIEKNDESTR